MLGKGITKLIGYITLGAIILAIGAKLLSSVASIVLAFRIGNVFPFASVALITILLLLSISRLNENTSLYAILSIVGYAATGYLIVVVFMMTIPLGLLLSCITTGISAALCSILRNPKQAQQYFGQAISQIRISGVLNGQQKNHVRLRNGNSFALNASSTLLIIKKGSRDKLLQLMRERPLLPISYTHYVDCDILFIDENTSTSKTEKILELLLDYKIETKRIASSLLVEAIQMVPVLDSQHGLKIDDYRVTNDEVTITNLLQLSPPRLTIFPTKGGLCALIPEIDAPGLNVEPIRRGYENEVVLNRNFIHAREVEKQIETTA